MRKMLIPIIIYLLVSTKSAAATTSDYDVEWPSSEEKGIHLLVITINGCSTKFKIKDEDFYAFSDNDKALDQALDKSFEHCR